MRASTPRVDAGVDMIEFDVLPERDGDRLIVAHDYEDAAGRAPQPLEETLAYLAGDRFTGVELDVDLKLPGYELRVLEALRAAGLLDRVSDLVSAPLEPRAPARRRSCGKARLVGAEAHAGPVPLARDTAAGVRGVAGVPVRAPVAGCARGPGASLRRADGALAPGDAAARAPGSGRGRRGVRVDGRRAAAHAGAATRSASPA